MTRTADGPCHAGDCDGSRPDALRLEALNSQIGHRFRQELPLADIQAALRRGEEPGPVPDWTM
jgi:hypothetical protein